MLSGISLTAYYIIHCVFLNGDRWTLGLIQNGITPEAFGMIGMLVNFTIVILLTPFFSPPSDRIKVRLKPFVAPKFRQYF